MDGPRFTAFTRSARYVFFVCYAHICGCLIPLSQFVEDEGDVVFYKNAYGLAKARAVFKDAVYSDSGIDVESE